MCLIGLSWQAADDGGVCQARRYFIRIYDNFSVQKQKSYNTGVITYKFFGGLVPPKIGEIAFLRQVGTAFGAPVSQFAFLSYKATVSRSNSKAIVMPQFIGLGKCRVPNICSSVVQSVVKPVYKHKIEIH